jgi:kumamolisin
VASRKKAGTGTGSPRKPAAGRKAKAASASRARVAKARAGAGVHVKDSEREAPQNAERIGKPNSARIIHVTLALRGPKLPDAGKLGGRPLSAKQFAARYGASRRDIDKVSQVIRKSGMKIEGVSAATRNMRVSGTVAQMETVFRPSLVLFTSKEQGEFIDRDGDYRVPGALQGIVKAVLGFGQRRVACRRPAIVKTGIAHPLRKFSPAALETQYRFPPGDAADQKIAIAEFGGGYFANDLVKYCAKFGRPRPTVNAISIDTPIRSLAQIKQQLRTRATRKDAIDSTSEVMMDVQVVAGLCPAAEISVYFAKDHQKGWIDLLSRVIDDRPVALSISWGLAEDSRGWSKAARTAINERLLMAAACGITVCCSSGDDGSGDMQTDNRTHVDFPSSSPYVLAVGGTMIIHKGNKFTEQAWRVGPGRRVDDAGGATGGGVSVKFPRASWQKKIKIDSANKKGRVVPDVAALAGPPGYDMIFRNRDDYGGGTSASAPLWAALIARVNALLPSDRRGRFLVPSLYRKSSHGVEMGRLVCHDITIGNNITKPKPNRGFKATKGFDAVSGWGTPIGTALLLALT